MPTGYTAGILDGSIKTFKQFATTCMRAFGAIIHMRDDSLSKKYEPRTPSKYYIDKLEEAKENLENLKTISDEEIIKSLKKTLLEEQKTCKKNIHEKLKVKERLEKILSDVHKWTPPTNNHKEFKDFMEEQLNITLDADVDTLYYDNNLARVKEELLKLEDKTKHQQLTEEYREKLIEVTEDDIEHYTERLNEEIERCNNSNKWVEDLVKSIK